MKEGLLVLGEKELILYTHLPNGRTSCAIPDSRKLWEFLWEWRARIRTVVHSHPGKGLPKPSSTDLGTFRAIEDGLGLKLYWTIISEDYRATYWRINGEYVLYDAHYLMLDPIRTWPYWLKVLHRESYKETYP